MTGIELFIVDKMSAYIARGVSPEQAARFTRGELLAIYKGDSWSRNGAGQFIKTLPPEVLDIETAMEKVDAEIVKYCAEQKTPSPPDLYTKPTALLPTTAPAATIPMPSDNKLRGFDKMLDYARRPA